jgi:hypothetical protein
MAAFMIRVLFSEWLLRKTTRNISQNSQSSKQKGKKGVKENFNFLLSWLNTLNGAWTVSSPKFLTHTKLRIHTHTVGLL